MRAPFVIILIFALSDICVAKETAATPHSESKAHWSGDRFEHREQDPKKIKEFVSALLDEYRSPPIDEIAKSNIDSTPEADH